MLEEDTPFHGLLHHRHLFEDVRLWESIGHTLLITGVTLPIEPRPGLPMAFLFVEKLPGRPIFVALLVLPTLKEGDAETVFNSLFIAGGSTLLAMFFGTIAAYSLTCFCTGGRTWRCGSSRAANPAGGRRLAARCRAEIHPTNGINGEQ